MQGGLRAVSALAAVLALAWASGCGGSATADASEPPKWGAEVVLDGGGGIVLPDDGDQAAECEPDDCNFQLQSGCSDAQTCLPSVTADGVLTSGCFDPGTKDLGDECKVANDCLKGQACAGGECRKLCCAGDWKVCDEGESCFRQFEYLIDEVIVPTGAWVCYPVGTCSVLDPKACDSTGEDCKLVDSRGSEACMPKSPGELGESCGAAGGRVRGLTCVGKPGAQTCRRLCRAEECGEPSCPTEEGTCVHFDRDPAGVGECT